MVDICSRDGYSILKVDLCKLIEGCWVFSNDDELTRRLQENASELNVTCEDGKFTFSESELETVKEKMIAFFSSENSELHFKQCDINKCCGCWWNCSRTLLEDFTKAVLVPIEAKEVEITHYKHDDVILQGIYKF